MSFLTVLLYPFAVLYDAITRVRNYMYNIGYKTSFLFEANVISVGNLSVGGTGKTPMVEYLIRLLTQKRLVTLSRGYGRKTKGFLVAGKDDSAATIGDEPFQIYNKFKDIHVTVGEERAMAIPFILAEFPDTEVILLDDAFQHRPVKPSLSILLTDYNRPFYNDYLLPAGRLRENRKGADRADIIVVTKCPDEIDYEGYENEIRKYNNDALIAFSTVAYGKPMRWNGAEENAEGEVLLVSGIANPAGLRKYVSEKYKLVDEIIYQDHYKYRAFDLDKIVEAFKQVKGESKFILTTEKDFVKLKPLLVAKGIDIPLFYLPIETTFVKGGRAFDETVLNSIISYSN
ncbi:tetraacyldisaccharide 4'-kinase [Fulvivirga sediminis]|uniref:Tetraacyldisaccharide 4'-kinase n=1 Tax=Fulvivirga sediminis TaxID=2803949 RepID=A0A937F2V5_9BACT|nr:tetraacyldisaccharide 4'-kinase [Fulvivirga sediminis]MBL3655307.1 tetraacyldisaccharide 4'-kinase [Fulvivirga sediminis]